MLKQIIHITQTSTSWETPYKLSGNEKAAETGYSYFGARYYDSDLSVWLSVDPLVDKYPSMSSYMYTAGNPVTLVDPDGRDVVYMGEGGSEVHRVKDDKINKTFIVDNKAQTVQITNLGLDGGKGWIEAKMPEMLVDENGNTLSDAKYQQYDHLIAAETAYFNQNKNSGKTPTHTNGLSVDDSRTVPDLDPTLVKSIIYQESRVGNYDGNKNDNNNSLQDIMQANVYYNASSHDWHKGKQQFGLTRGGGATPRQSVHAGIGILYQKGLRTSNDLSSTKFLGWDVATQNYNARNPNYSKEVYSRIPKR
ncbi:MAG: hypothetical protein AUJ98_05215 [Bacteroidetes bacterium CG2_30_33_31]|nr:MAG: hypothetical protein AUJ98_05215 [Bacteroidetes bacterium CG2_30_33_31]